MWQFADRLIDAFSRRARARWSAPTPSPFTLTVIADLEGVPESDHSLFRERLSTAHQDVGAQAARVPLRALQRLHRGSPPAPAKRRAHRPGHRHLPRRLDPRGQGCRPDRRQSLRRRPGDRRCGCCRSRCACSASGPTSKKRCGPTARRSRTSSRRPSGSRARCGPSSGWPASPPSSAGVDIPAGASLMLIPGACNRDPRVFDESRRVRHRPPERPAAHRLRARHPHVCRSAAGPSRGPGHHQPVPRPDGRHLHLGRAPRSGRRPSLRVPPDLLPPWPPEPHLEFTPVG